MSKDKNKQHRFFVYEKSNYSCQQCRLKFIIPDDWDKVKAIHNGEMYLEIDHIIPKSKGGDDSVNNKQALCQKCNIKKSNKVGV